MTEENQLYVSGRLEIANMTEFYKATKETRFLPDNYVTNLPHLNEFAITKLSIKSKLGERKLRYGRFGNHLLGSSHQKCSIEKVVLKNFAKFTGKQLRQKVPATLLKKSLWHRCFPVNFATFLRTPFL